MSLDQLRSQLRQMLQLDIRYKDKICSDISRNRYREHLQECLITQKEQMRAQTDCLSYRSGAAYRMQQVLNSSLDYPDLELTEDEKKDKELVQSEMVYKQELEVIKAELAGRQRDIQRDCEQSQRRMEEVLKNQMRWRPIDQMDFDKAADAVKIRYEQAETDARALATNKILVMRNKISENRKKRRNFGKDAVEKLQKYYDSHKDNPYPSDEDKAKLAEDCNISIQQVANWFGNRRIRSKKVHPETEDGKN